MKTSAVLLAASLACKAFSAAIPFQDTSLDLSGGAYTRLDRRGEWKNNDELNDLLDEAADADQQRIDSSINYLSGVFSSKGITWALMGGVAMQKHGMQQRATHDSDIVVSVNPLGLRNAIVNDPNIYATPLGHAISGISTIFVSVSGELAQSDIVTRGSDLAPGLGDAVTIDGWPVISAQELARSKIKSGASRGEEKDIADVVWLCDNKEPDVRAAAANLPARTLSAFASEVEDKSEDDLDRICEVLGLDCGSDSS